jgi:dolichol kinase
MNKIVRNIQKNKKTSIDYDAHWFRRVFHTAGTLFLVYYMLPDEGLLYYLKILGSILIVISLSIIEILRLTGKINEKHFFGLRDYEKKRPASYLYFGLGMIILFLFFPQQIAIPCILCACIADPVIGEIRSRFGKKESYITGFLLCMSLFMIMWYKTDILLLLIVSIVGASGALLAEIKKIWWIDDDFLIQMIPAVLLLTMFVVAQYFEFIPVDYIHSLPKIIHPW